MSNVPTNKLGTAEQLRDADIILLRKMYGCGKILYTDFDSSTIKMFWYFLFSNRFELHPSSQTPMQEQVPWRYLHQVRWMGSLQGTILRLHVEELCQGLQLLLNNIGFWNIAPLEYNTSNLSFWPDLEKIDLSYCNWHFFCLILIDFEDLHYFEMHTLENPILCFSIYLNIF